MKKIITKTVFLISLYLSVGAQTTNQQKKLGSTDSSFAPLVDHHLHLLSPAGATFKTPPFLPEVKLPKVLAYIVSERQPRWNDQKALAELYTQNSLYFNRRTNGWVRGREASAGYVKWTVSDTPYLIKPVTYDLNASTGRIAGYFVEDDGTDQYFGYFQLDVTKIKDGTWRIASEMYVYQPPEFAKPYTAEQLIKERWMMSVFGAALYCPMLIASTR